MIKNQQVIIIGGGIAGLWAGIKLAKEGREFVIYEAAPVIGGNAGYTVVDGDKVSTGVLYGSKEMKTAFDKKGIAANWRVIADPAEGGFIGKKFYPGFYEEMGKRDAGFQRFTDDLNQMVESEAFGDPITNRRLKPAARRLDELSTAEYIFKNNYRDTAKRVLDLYCSAAYGASTDYISALAVLCFFAFEKAEKYTIEGGGYGFIAALKNHLDKSNFGEILTNAPVHTVKPLSDHSVEITGTRSGKPFHVQAEGVIVTTPLHVAAEFINDPDKQQIIREMPRVRYAVHNAPLKAMKAYTGWTPGQMFPAVVNNVWGRVGVTGNSIRISDPLGPREEITETLIQTRKGIAAQYLSELFPGSNVRTDEIQTKTYSDAFPFCRPFYMSRHMPLFRKATGPVVHGGQLSPCMESGLNEAERAVEYILQRR